MRTPARYVLAFLGCITSATAASAQLPVSLPPDTTAPLPATHSLDSAAERSAPPALDIVRITGTNRRATYVPPEISSATKTGLPLRDIPQSVTVITRPLMEDQGMRSMADVVRYVPGVTMGQGEGNRDQPTIRGNATTADFYVDGVRDDVQYYRDLYNVERVETLKGSNAMIFGRGGGGGVMNRVIKEAGWGSLRELTLEGGSYADKRMSADVGQGLSQSLAGRINGMYQNSGLFRDAVRLTRYGINPTVTITPASRTTKATFGYEYFSDHRTADRGIPSFGGRPLETDASTFFGNPELSYSDARVHAATATLEHESSNGVSIRNHSHFASYDKIYQNIFPGAVSANGTEVSIAAYRQATPRNNLFNQTDITLTRETGQLRHGLLVGWEIGRQLSDNFRQTGYFNDTTTSVLAPITDPRISTPVTFRQSATDADSRIATNVASLYAQDQIELSERWRLIAGLRYESFRIRYHNNRSDSTLRGDDAMLSPRAGLIYKPATPVSLYASYGVSYLPGSGDQFSSLTDLTKALEPERFTNYELGAKWDVAGRLAITTAIYRLDRTNTRAPAPNLPGVTVQTGSQHTRGYEVGVSGSVTSDWEIAGGYASQSAFITSTTTAAAAGATVPLVPRSTVSLWNKYQIVPRWSLGFGVIHQARMYAAVDNTVTLPAFTRIDGAVYFTLSRNLRAQLNVENLLDRRYYSSSNGNNNIAPGSPRAFHLSLTTGF